MAIWSAEIKELERLYESFKGQLPDLEKELGQLTQFDDPNVVLLYSRRCLEVIITNLCDCELKRERGTEPLKGIIDKLNKEKKIPAHIASSMYGLNELSTYGTHPKDFVPEQVKPVLNNLDTIIKWYLKYKGIKIKPHIEGKIKDLGKPIVEVEGTKEVRIEQQKRPVILRKNKLLSRVLIIAILLIAAILIYSKIFKRYTLEKLRLSGDRISIAVMPFKNLTTDSTFNIWQSGLQNLLITSLSNSEELSVRQFEIMDEILKGAGQINYASITPSFASEVASKLEANTVILGNVYNTGNIILVTANLMDSKTEEIYKSFEMEGSTEDDFFPLTDSLANLIMNYLQIKQLGKKYAAYDLKNVYTSSAESYKYYIQGRNYHGRLDYSTAVDLYIKSIKIDTNFVSPMLMLAYVLGEIDKTGDSRMWAYKAYHRKDNMPYGIQLQIGEVKAFVDKEPEEQIRYLKQYLEFNPYSTLKFYSLGWVNFNIENWTEAINAFEKGIELNKKYGGKYKLWIWQYLLLGDAYLKVGEYDKAMKTYEVGLNLWPDQNLSVTCRLSVCAFLQGDSLRANELIEKVKTIGNQKRLQESEIFEQIANIYFGANSMNKAEEYYRKALSLELSNPVRMNALAYFLINSDRNIGEGLEIIDKALNLSPDEYYMLDTWGWGLYKQGMYNEALEVLDKSWELRPSYSHEAYLHLEAAKKAVANQKNN